MLFRRYFLSVMKEKYDTENYEIRKKRLYIISIFTGIGAVFFFALWEVIFLMFISLIIFIFRRTIAIYYLSTIYQYDGKIKWARTVSLSCCAVWLGLALFYRTDFGMPIGVKNYLYHKYWEEFEVSGFFGATPWGHPTNEFTCYPQSGNPYTDSFNVVRKNTFSVGSRRFASDNYFGVLIREDYENYISSFIDDYFDEFEVHVYFDFSGLSNIEYMSDDFDKRTSLKDFLSFQKDEDKGRGCNSARVEVCLKNPSDVKDKELTEKKAVNLFNDLTEQYSYLSVYIIPPGDGSGYIVGMISYDSKLFYYDVSDNFFKNEEEK